METCRQTRDFLSDNTKVSGKLKSWLSCWQRMPRALLLRRLGPALAVRVSQRGVKASVDPIIAWPWEGWSRENCLLYYAYVWTSKADFSASSDILSFNVAWGEGFPIWDLSPKGTHFFAFSHSHYRPYLINDNLDSMSLPENDDSSHEPAAPSAGNVPCSSVCRAGKVVAS